ncbi:MAG: ATP-binding cassette domain-containing protein [Acidobacteriota bacterium]
MIEVSEVSKHFGPVKAVDQVSFRMDPGEIVGFLGPNGAGKSTLLKMMVTWLLPTAGRIAIDGHDVVREPLAVRRLLGYLPEHSALYEGMKVDRFLRFMGRMRGLSGDRLQERLEWCIDACDLKAVLAKWCRECSKGYRQRIGVAAALIHDPPVLLLDEPTHGLDPVQVVAFRDFLRDLREDRAILFSSHILAEVVAVSDRLLVINEGQLLADTPVDELRKEAGDQDLERVLLDIVQAGRKTATAGEGAKA